MSDGLVLPKARDAVKVVLTTGGTYNFPKIVHGKTTDGIISLKLIVSTHFHCTLLPKHSHSPLHRNTHIRGAVCRTVG